MPASLPHREEQIQRLGSVLAPALSKERVSNIFAYGKTGTGKTIVARFVLDRLQKKARDYGRAVDTSYVNCRLSGTNYRVIARKSTIRSEEHTSELQSQSNLVCRLLLEKKKKKN